MTKRFRPDVDAPEWKGGHAPYDIVKEGAIALLAVAILTLVLAIVFGSPDESAITLKSWSNAAPIDFAQDALSQLNGTSETATYGPPYNNASIGQELGPLSLAKWVGVTMSINTAKVFVLDPLKTQPSQPALSGALKEWSSASSTTRHSWVTNYTNGATHMKWLDGAIVVKASHSGPVPEFINELTDMARTGALDAVLTHQGDFYTTNYTLPLALSRRWKLSRQPGNPSTPRGRPVGHDERDRQLPGSSLAVVVHVLVPDPAVQLEWQRRHPRLGTHDAAHVAARPRTVHSGPSLDSAQGEDLQTHLERALSEP